MTASSERIRAGESARHLIGPDLYAESSVGEVDSQNC